ncbi:MAG: VWA-like domain-containing protein [Candidatus Methanomethylophilaceae archaeon]
MEHDTAKEILSGCSSDLCLDLRFMTRAILSMDRVLVPGIGGPSCDGERIVMDPEWAVSSYRKDPNIITRSMAHLTLHCLLGHRIPDDDTESLAQDMIVEYVLDSLDTPHITDPGRDDRRYYCETYFKRAGGPLIGPLAKELSDVSDHRMKELRRLFSGDDHSVRPIPDDPRWEELSKRAMVEIEGFSEKLSDRSGGLMAILRIRNRRRYDYRAFLRRFMTVRSRVKESMDEFDPIYYSYGLSVYGNIPLIDSLEYSESPGLEQFVIAIDTSGSTMKGPVIGFIQEAFGIMKVLSPSHGSELHIIQCDDMVRRDDTIRSEQDLNALMDGFVLEGGNGTDFRPVFSYVDNLRSEGRLRGLKGLIFFTDGMGIYPSKRPEYDTAFVICEEIPIEHPIPPWAMRISVRPSDIA